MRSGNQDPVAIAIVGLIVVVVVSMVATTLWTHALLWLSVAFFIGIGALLVAAMIKGGFIRWPR